MDMTPPQHAAKASFLRQPPPGRRSKPENAPSPTAAQRQAETGKAPDRNPGINLAPPRRPPPDASPCDGATGGGPMADTPGTPATGSARQRRRFTPGKHPRPGPTPRGGIPFAPDGPQPQRRSTPTTPRGERHSPGRQATHPGATGGQGGGATPPGGEGRVKSLSEWPAVSGP